MTRTVTFVQHWLHIRGLISSGEVWHSDFLITERNPRQRRLKEGWTGGKGERNVIKVMFSLFFCRKFQSIHCHIDLEPIIQAQAHQHTKQCSESNFCNWQFHRGDLFHQFWNLAHPEGGQLCFTQRAMERSVTALLCGYKENKETCFSLIWLQKVLVRSDFMMGLHKQTALNTRIERCAHLCHYSFWFTPLISANLLPF